jgi:histone H3/H4
MEWNAMSKFINSLRAGAQTQAEATMMKDTGEIVHNCAKHVEHAEWGPGATLAEEHAAPDESGNIAWYDIMFEHGLERQVPTASLNILVSETHKHAGKKMKESVNAGGETAVIDLGSNAKSVKAAANQTKANVAMPGQVAGAKEGGEKAIVKKMTAEGMEDFAKSQAKKRAAARKEKELAALGHPKDKVTHKDVLIGRGVLAKEEVEELDELSKKTLSSYMSKADAEKSTHMDASVRAKRLANNVGAMKDINVGNPEHAAAMRKAATDYQGSLSKDAERHDATWKKRSAGIKTAMGKYYAKEEVEELDEASIKLFMGFYQVWHKGKKVGSYASRSDAQDHARSLKEEVEEFTIEDFSLEEIQDFMMSEDFDQLDELSKKTLGSYVDKAKQSVVDTKRAAGQAAHQAFKNEKRSPSAQIKHLNARDALNAAAKKREAGISKANARLANEAVEELDELSKKTLGSYVKSAADRATHNRRMAVTSWERADRETDDNEKEKFNNFGQSQFKKYKNRITGVGRAVDRLTKEDLDFTEAVDETIEYKTVSIQVNEADKNYDGYFKAAMKAHGVKHPGELKSTEDKKKFFNKVDAGFKAKNEDVFIEAWMRSDVEERIAAHTKAGNKISDQKHTTKAGQGHHSFVVTEPSGKRTRHIFHGNSRKLETMSAAPKSKLAHEAGEDEDDK